MKLEFKLMLGVQTNEEMPEELKDRLTQFVQDNVQETIHLGMDELVDKYCEEKGIKRGKISESTKVQRYDSTEDFSRAMSSNTTLEDFFSKIGKERGISKRKPEKSSEDSTSKILKNLQSEISELSDGFSPEDTDEDKSLRAFQILDLRIKAEIMKMEEGLDHNSDLVKNVQDSFDRLKAKADGMEASDRRVVEKLNQDFSRSVLVIEQGASDLKKLQIMDLDEYKNLDYKSRGSYLLDTKNRFTAISDFVEEEMNSIKSKLLQAITGHLGFGDHLGIVLS